MLSAAAGNLRRAIPHADFRAYQHGDEDQIVDLLAWRFEKDLAVRHWRWKLGYWRTTAANVWLASVDRKLVFHYGGIPLRFRLDGATVESMISVDAMTAAPYRRRGLLTRGVALAFEEWKANGVAFTLGLPNERWGSRIAAAGWQRLFPMRWMVRPLRLERVAARRLRMPWLNRLRLMSSLWRQVSSKRLYQDPRLRFQQIRDIDGSFDRLWLAREADAAFSTVRDAAWVNWRFLLSPAREYEVKLAWDEDEPVGYYAARLAQTPEKTSAFVAELVSVRNDRGVAESLLSEAISWADRADADLIASLAVPGTDAYSLFRKCGFLAGPAFQVHMVPLEADGLSDRLRDPRNWHLSGADFDVI